MVRGLLFGLAALFVAAGAVLLHMADPTDALTPGHLIALIGGWSLAWGVSWALLRRHRAAGDPFILPTAALLSGWGLVLQARLAPRFMLRQTLWLILSCGAMCAVALVPTLLRLLRRYRYTLLVGGLLLLGMTLVFGVNPSGYGQRLWLGAFGVYAQPSEPLKLLLIIYLAAYLSDRRDLVKQKLEGKSPWLVVLGPMLVMVGIAMLLLGWQQDLGAALLFYLTFMAMVYLAWGKTWHVAVALLLFAPVGIAGTLLSDRVALRVSIWLNPWAPGQADRAYQLLQSLFALASGGLGGQGLGQGIPTLIPAVHTDFVYAALVEEFGLAGGLALLALMGLLAYRGLTLAQRAAAPFESLLAGGIATLFAVQTWVIVGGNAKLIPITGVTLPFLSYGGSSLLTTLVATGLLLNLAAPHPELITLELPASQMPPMPQAPPLRRTAGRLGKAILLMLASTALVTGIWTVVRAPQLRAYTTNPRRILAEARIRRGRILDRDSEILADIVVDEDGYVTRTYPVPEAAPVVGYNTLQYGTAGIEGACDARLRGEIDRTAWEATWDGVHHRHPVGRDVRVTLDADVQRTAQRLLDGYVGAAVLVDARNGEILTLASSPTYTPTAVETRWARLRDDPDAPLLNRATQGLAQPGAILETVVLAAGLQAETLSKPPQPLTGTVAVDGSELTCAFPPTAHTWRGALRAACPAPFAELGRRLGDARLAEAFAAWGLVTAPDLALPTVAAPWDPTDMDPADEALGQGQLLVTPLHMVGVAATLANDGVRVPLYLLETPQAGCPMPPASSGTRVLEADMAAQLRAMWAPHGSAIGHRGMALAGPERMQAWFVGINSPIVPRYAVAVLIENPADRRAPADIGAQLLQQVVHPAEEN
jgi:cell division protein FtsW (lipid II flippase)